MLAVQHALQISGVTQCIREQDNNTQGTENRPREDIESPDRGVPFPVQSHHPVDRAERERNSADRNKKISHPTVADRMNRGSILVLCQRIAPQKECPNTEQEEVEDSTHPKEVNVQVSGLFGQFMVGRR